MSGNSIGLNDTLASGSRVERSTGEFLVLSRFITDDNVLELLQTVPAVDFLKELGVTTHGVISGSDLSNICVRAFDSGMAEVYGVGRALFAYRTVDGRIIHQHST